MKVYFWGTRGSLPATVLPKHIEKKIRLALELAVDHGLSSKDDIDEFIENELSFDIRASYGCNTSCVEVRGGSEFVVCDAGSGLRDFGNYVMSSGARPPQTFNIMMSHLHWDHINGFPFFVPAFIPGNVVNIYGYHERLEEAFVRQQDPISFPLALEDMGATINFHVLDTAEPITVGGFKVSAIEQNHPGDSYGIAFEKDGQKLVYSTDSEHFADSDAPDYRFIPFFQDADLLIFDAQYNLADHFHAKASWGHSSNMVAVELALRSDVKHLCLFHNEHTVDDHQLEGFLADSRRYLELHDPDSDLRIDLAYDGMEIDLSQD
ncbi:MAG: MBL fold metallo-hydrolase [Xanthomonadales bacterium]|nr:MBL fold metallo-hydrolase [Xanthomonadales bacterium]